MRWRTFCLAAVAGLGLAAALFVPPLLGVVFFCVVVVFTLVVTVLTLVVTVFTVVVVLALPGVRFGIGRGSVAR